VPSTRLEDNIMFIDGTTSSIISREVDPRGYDTERGVQGEDTPRLLRIRPSCSGPRFVLDYLARVSNVRPFVQSKFPEPRGDAAVVVCHALHEKLGDHATKYIPPLQRGRTPRQLNFYIHYNNEWGE